ncbi:MAG TPA: thioesterase family protein [Thermoanaerobaculia bacterium]|jgi:acyl-CoA thioester hydrolase
MLKDGWYVVPWQVIFRDLDAFGHVNNAVYLSYFEWARAKLWFELTGGANARDISFIVARAEIDFKAQIGLEPIELAVRVGEMRTTSFDTLYEIRNQNGKQLAATGRVVLVLFDWKRHAKLPIPDDLREKVRTLFGRE